MYVCTLLHTYMVPFIPSFSLPFHPVCRHVARRVHTHARTYQSRTSSPPIASTGGICTIHVPVENTCFFCDMLWGLFSSGGGGEGGGSTLIVRMGGFRLISVRTHAHMHTCMYVCMYVCVCMSLAPSLPHSLTPSLTPSFFVAQWCSAGRADGRMGGSSTVGAG